MIFIKIYLLYMYYTYMSKWPNLHKYITSMYIHHAIHIIFSFTKNNLLKLIYFIDLVFIYKIYNKI